MNPRDFDESILPWSPEAESSVLGALLLAPDTWDNVADTLQAKSFFDDRNGRVYEAIGSLAAACKPVDIFTVLDNLQTAGRDNGIEIEYLSALAQYVPSATNIRRYSEIIVERALMRDLMRVADEIKEVAVTAGTSPAERLEVSQSKLQALQLNRGRKVPVSAREASISMLDRIQDMADGKRTPGIPTRIPGLDSRIGGGLKAGKYIVIAARPSIGKSSFAEQICINVADQGIPVAMFSQEMENEELVDRATSNIGQINLDGIQRGRLQDSDWSALSDAVERIGNLPLYFDDQPSLSLADIAAKARALVRQHGIKVLVIDYIQLCAGNGQSSRHHQIEEISRGLKSLAKSLGIAIIVLSQLGREVEKRTSGRPMLSDLKESGAIEEDADVVILLSLVNVRHDETKVICADVAKARGGRTGQVALAFVGKYQRWTETIDSLEPSRPMRQRYTDEA